MGAGESSPQIRHARSMMQTMTGEVGPWYSRNSSVSQIRLHSSLDLALARGLQGVLVVLVAGRPARQMPGPGIFVTHIKTKFSLAALKHSDRKEAKNKLRSHAESLFAVRLTFHFR